jgi:hypothetical protein
MPKIVFEADDAGFSDVWKWVAAQNSAECRLSITLLSPPTSYDRQIKSTRGAVLCRPEVVYTLVCPDDDALLFKITYAGMKVIRIISVT